MNRNLLAAPICALALAGILTGVASAADEPRLCDTVRSELADAELAAKLPVGIGGATFTSLPALEQYIGSLPDIPAVAESRAAAQAVLDAAGRVTVLQQEVTTCVEETTDPEPTVDPDPTTDVPAPTSDVPAPTTAAPVPPATDLDCRGLSADQAVSVLQADPSDPHRLDSDGDGVPCEVEDLAGDSPVESSPGGVSQVPSGSIDSGFTA